MNARTHSLTERAVTDYFVFASLADEHVHWLADTLVGAGVVEAATLDPSMLMQRIATLNPSLVFVDFSGGRAAAASAAASAVRAAYPGMQIVALGSLAEPESALAALRAGVRDFIDLSAPAEDALRITRQVLDNLVEPVSRHGHVTALLGARIGMGVSTLAANLAVMLQRRDVAQGRQAALLDLGLPAGDGSLLLNTRSEFNFVEAVRNLRRFDQTFVHTALSHHSSGLALTTLPPNLADMREVSYSSSIGLLNRLRAFFDQQIVDLGGFTNSEFIAHVVQAADETWLLCDQGVASIVSAVGVLDALREEGVDTANVRLIVNKFDADLGLAAAQIAQRLDIPLLATLPERRVALGQAVNQGHLLADVAARDPYVRALEPLIERLGGAARAPRRHAANRRSARSSASFQPLTSGHRRWQKKSNLPTTRLRSRIASSSRTSRTRRTNICSRVSRNSAPSSAAGRVTRSTSSSIWRWTVSCGCAGYRSTRAKCGSIAEALTKELAGFGPIEDLLADPAVEDILINGYNDVYVSRHGILTQDPGALCRQRASAADRAAHSRADRPASGRIESDGRCAPAERRARERGDRAAVDRRADRVDPQIPQGSDAARRSARATAPTTRKSARCSKRRWRRAATCWCRAARVRARPRCSMRWRFTFPSRSGS